MASSEWRLSLKLLDQPSLLKSVLQFPEPEPGDVPPGEYRVSTLKQLVSAHIPDAIPDPELIEIVYCGRKLKDDLTLESYGIQSGSTVHILRKSWPEPEIHPEPVDKVAASREFRVLQAALHTSTAYRDSVFKMLNNKESLDQIMVATPGLSSDPVALGTESVDLSTLLGLHGMRQLPRLRRRAKPITLNELANLLCPLLSTLSMLLQQLPNQYRKNSGPSSGVSPIPAGTPITNDLFNQALQQALQVSSMSSLNNQWQSQLQQLRDMGIRDEELILRALQATGGDIQAALELIFAGGAP
ncbi:hypothetical protein cypCar_00028795 [Cyprinus carpio]|nr:hypothetical protein cypCar_00028795 [Cyprinus carpio]